MRRWRSLPISLPLFVTLTAHAPDTMLNIPYLMARNSRLWHSLLAWRRLRQKPMYLCQSGTSQFYSSTNVHEEAENSAADGSEVELMKTFLTRTTKLERFDYAKKICKSSRVSRLNLLSPNELQDFYGLLRKDIATSSLDEIIDLIEHIVDARDPFMEFLSTELCKRVREFDFKTLLRLAEMFVKLKHEDCTVPIYNRLTTLFGKAMHGDTWLEPQEIYRTVTVLNNTGKFGSHLGLVTADYLSRHLLTFDPEYASMLVAFVAKRTQFNKAKGHFLFDAVKVYLLSILHQLPPTRERRGRWGRNYGSTLSNFMTFYARVKLYDSDVMGVMKELLYGPEDSEIHSPRFLSRFMSMCTRVRYYDKELFDHIVKVSLAKLGDFPCVELGIVLYALAHLNHEHHLFLDEVVKVAEEKFQDAVTFYPLYWDIIKSCLFMNRYYPAVLRRFLSDDVIKVSRAEKPMIFDVLYLRLLISMVVENRGLGYKSTNRRGFFKYPFHIEGLSEDHAHSSLFSHIGMYRGVANSIFGSNFKRALKGIVSRECFLSEVITMGGYVIDFEVLLGANNKVIAFPHFLRERPCLDALRSIGAAPPGHGGRPGTYIKSNTVPPLINALKECEESGNDVDSLYLPEVLKVIGSRRKLVMNFASDWTKYLLHGRPKPLPHRKIAFELNGPSHYAVNEPRHIMGKDVVKYRQLEALGWKVIQVPYFEWQELKTGDDHINYVASKLFENCN